MSSTPAAKVQSFSFISYVGLFQPAFKLSSDVALGGESALYVLRVERGADFGLTQYTNPHFRGIKPPLYPLAVLLYSGLTVKNREYFQYPSLDMVPCMKVNGGDFILKGYSGGIIIQNTSPVEKIRIILY